MMSSSSILLVGLGNPGKKYAGTRHNVGFDVVDRVAARYGLTGPKTKFNAALFEGEIAGQKVYALKPQTFMNHSGQSVQAAMAFYKVPLEQVVVIHDELDVAVGKVKAKLGGGAGGHNGIRDIDRACGKEYHRIRIGIDHPGHKDQVHGYVLKPFSTQQQPVIDAVAEAVAKQIEAFISDGRETFLTKVALELGK